MVGELFKYVSAKRVDILESGKIRFTPPIEQNDPFESIPRMHTPPDSLLEARIREEQASRFPSLEVDGADSRRIQGQVLKRYKEEWELSLRTFPQKFQAEFSEKFGMLCLTRNKSSLLMWAHYADAHRGFVLEFNPNHQFFTPGELHEVQYSQVRPAYDYVNPNPKEIFLTKSSEWGYEQELRMFRHISNLDEVFRADLPPTCIMAIFLGCRMADLDRENVLLALKKPGCENIKVFETRLMNDSFTLSFSAKSDSAE